MEVSFIPDAVEVFDEYGFAVFKDKERNSDGRQHVYKCEAYFLFIYLFFFKAYMCTVTQLRN